MGDNRSSVFRFTHAALMVLVLGLYSATDNGISPVRADSSDDYLKAVEAEGDHLEFLGQARKEQEMLMRSAPRPVTASPRHKADAPKQTAKAPPATASAPPVSVSQRDFEMSLREHFPGSYALYTILEPREREIVFREYANARTEGTIRFLPAVSRLIALSSMSRTR